MDESIQRFVHFYKDHHNQPHAAWLNRLSKENIRIILAYAGTLTDQLPPHPDTWIVDDYSPRCAYKNAVRSIKRLGWEIPTIVLGDKVLPLASDDRPRPEPCPVILVQPSESGAPSTSALTSNLPLPPAPSRRDFDGTPSPFRKDFPCPDSPITSVDRRLASLSLDPPTIPTRHQTPNPPPHQHQTPASPRAIEFHLLGGLSLVTVRLVSLISSVKAFCLVFFLRRTGQTLPTGKVCTRMHGNNKMFSKLILFM